MTQYKGDVVFVAEVHYPVGKDGHADLSRPLRVNGDGNYRDAEMGELGHNDANPANLLELPEIIAELRSDGDGG